MNNVIAMIFLVCVYSTLSCVKYSLNIRTNQPILRNLSSIKFAYCAKYVNEWNGKEWKREMETKQ